jgi:hypothetical protein
MRENQSQERGKKDAQFMPAPRNALMKKSRKPGVLIDEIPYRAYKPIYSEISR